MFKGMKLNDKKEQVTYQLKKYTNADYRITDDH
jgi:hypothetical protein